MPFSFTFKVTSVQWLPPLLCWHFPLPLDHCTNSLQLSVTLGFASVAESCLNPSTCLSWWVSIQPMTDFCRLRKTQIFNAKYSWDSICYYSQLSTECPSSFFFFWACITVQTRDISNSSSTLSCFLLFLPQELIPNTACKNPSQCTLM